MTPDQEQRFWSKVNKADCWIWIGATNSKGYGSFGLDGKTTSTHRISYMIHKGDIPGGMVVCHTCNNPPCVNPDHLYLGTAYDNMRQAADEGRLAPQQKTHCKNGHEFTPENTKMVKQGSKPGRDPNATYRVCRECLKAQRKKRVYTPERKQYHAEYWQKHKGVPKDER